MLLTPLRGITGTKKKTVIKRIPLLVRKGATVPQLPQRMGCGVCPEPHVIKRVPMIRKNMTDSCKRKLDEPKADDNASGLLQSKPEAQRIKMALSLRGHKIC
jgi:hypothetical protein